MMLWKPEPALTVGEQLGFLTGDPSTQGNRSVASAEVCEFELLDR